MADHPWASHPFVRSVRDALGSDKPEQRLISILEAAKSKGRLPHDYSIPHRSTVNRWLSGERPIHKEAISELGDVLGLAGAATATAVEESYGAYWSIKKARHGQSATRPEGDAYQRALSELQIPPLQADNAIEALGKLLDSMGRGHFMLITTQSLPPAAFRPAEYPAAIASMYRAMDRGSLIAFITPTKVRLDFLRRTYGFSELHSAARFRQEFTLFRANYIARRQHSGDANPEDMAYRRTQMFEWDDFPMTPCGHTVTLIGESRGQGNVHRRVLERGPGSNEEVALIAENALNEGRIRLFAEEVIHKDASADSFVGTNATARKARGWFAEEIIQRMHGNPSGKPAL